MEYNTKTNTQLASSAYNVIIGLTIIWGFFVNWYMIKYVDMTWLLYQESFVIIIGYLAVVSAGVALFRKSDNPLVSFIGYNIVVFAFGSVLSIILLQYDTAIVKQALIVTGGFTIVMMILGTIYPSFFESIIGMVTLVAFAVIILELIAAFFFKTYFGWTDFIIAAVFCTYIAYDWGKALKLPKTVDNAIDSAARLYMDIINLFIRILRILNKK